VAFLADEAGNGEADFANPEHTLVQRDDGAILEWDPARGLPVVGVGHVYEQWWDRDPQCSARRRDLSRSRCLLASDPGLPNIYLSRAACEAISRKGEST
jgi:hypothetical protein